MCRVSGFRQIVALLVAWASVASLASAQQLNWIHARTPGDQHATTRVGSASAKQAPMQQAPAAQPLMSAKQAAAQAMPPQPTAERGTPRLAATNQRVKPAQYDAPLTEYPMEEAPMMAPSCELGGCECGEPTCGFIGDPSCGCEPMCGDIACGDPLCGDTCGCGDACCDTCGPSIFGCDRRGCVPVCIWLPPIREVSLFAGVQGHTGPLDKGRDGGNFGFHEGVNAGGQMAWLPWPGLGYQLGYAATQNQLNGDERRGIDDHYSQQFLTAGLFVRRNCGWQYGVVYDTLRDERWQSDDYSQVRGEISVVNPRGHEFGFTFAVGTNDNVIDIDNRVNQSYSAVDQYLLFYRLRGCSGGELRFQGGFAEDSKGLIGANYSVPLSNCWTLDGGFAYLIPEESNNGPEGREEAWNIGMSFTYHFGGGAKKWYGSPYRPLFNVADNGSLMVDNN